MRPMLATSAPELPRGAQWSYEFKWDGIRALIDIRDAQVRITTRNGNDVSVSYPELQALGADLDDALLDGEIVALADGVPSFERLTERMHVRESTVAHELAAQNPVAFIAFDVLRLYGLDLRARPLHERRDALTRLIQTHPRSASCFSLSPSFDDPQAVQTAARQFALEGVMAKQTQSGYDAGQRSAAWVKVKFSNRAEFVVIGWEAAARTPTVLSSLVLGYYEQATLRLAGKVGSGLSERTARTIRDTLTPADPPQGIELGHTPGRVLHWVLPATVVEVSYSQWSSAAANARLRHPVFVGIRTDKAAHEVQRDD